MTVSKAQQKAVNKYIKNNYDRLNITVPAGRKEEISAYADSKGVTVNGLVNSLLRSEMGIPEDEWKKCRD